MLVKERQKLSKSIYNYALYLRDFYKIKDDNFDIEYIVKDLGGDIIIPKVYGDLEGIVKTGDESFDIYVSQLRLEHSRRFLIAHELGHLLIGFKYPTDKWRQLKNGQVLRLDGDNMENEGIANEFACCFLMPEYRLKFIEEKVADASYPTQAIATHFNVPMSSVIWYRKKLEGQG